MPVVIVNGWIDDRNQRRISFVDLLRSHGNLGLPEAKRVLDEFADSGEVRLRLPSVSEAERFLTEAKAIGLACQIVSD
jgi:hypothetical protein